ncbi:MAG: 50S ribosomal protein L7ae [Candidatus Faecalibacterium intestinavium]|uniref:50S ribosomal protein L7ae n=1 Tax=Candidatus Faecalibacterium intestinavium TaxID=2838580 RepID=A0A9E2NPU3_9FIRM|nr:50S ribosomal protein L7ae [Candidatus Faecalibacterium intestinavium]
MPRNKKPPANPAPDPRQALFQAVSLCRKAGQLTMGFDAVEEAAVKGKAWLVLTASDASPKTVQRMKHAVGDLVDVLPMPLTQDQLSAVCHRAVAVYAVTDRNLAKLCYDRLTDCGMITNEEETSE